MANVELQTFRNFETDPARLVAREALEHAREDGATRRTSLSPAWTAMAHAQLGELDAAFSALETALSRGYRDVPGLRRSRWFAPLRDDLRFEPLLAKHGLGR